MGLAQELASDDEEEKTPAESDSYDKVESSAAADLCEALGVDKGKSGDVKTALGDYVEACVKRLTGKE